ncbi:MAG: hypothetical protein R2780_10640 [Crocinitomicaceae bacterium]|nr:hypothetical protein [Crocinitomicaceae bacterium]
MNQVKNSFLKKKSEIIINRNVWLKAPDDIKSVLIVSDQENQSLKRKVEELLPSASVYHLFLREIKEDRSTGFYHTVHKTDFNLTGALKNDKLINLEKMSTELLLDLSSGSELLKYFVNRSVSSLKIGNINTTSPSYYDLLVQYEADLSKTVDNIYDKLIKLTQNASKQV